MNSKDLKQECFGIFLSNCITPNEIQTKLYIEKQSKKIIPTFD